MSTEAAVATPVRVGDDGHYAALDGWRGTSIALVLLGHLFPLGPKVLGLNFAFATLGMAIFFTLSGFLITSLLLRNQNIGNFLIRRLFRIVPLAWLAMVVCLAAHGSDAAVWRAHLLFYANLPPFWLLDVTAHLWSLCLEMQFYFGVALVVAVLGVRGLLLLPVLAIGATLARVPGQEYASIVSWFRIDEILAGCTLALIVNGRLPAVAATVVRRVPAWLWLVGAFLATDPRLGPLNYLRPYLAAGMVGATLLSPGSGIARAMNNRVLAYLALVSFALYVLHPLLAETWLGSGDKFEKYAKRPLLMVALFALAHLSTTQFESRWIALGRRLSQRWTIATTRRAVP